MAYSIKASNFNGQEIAQSARRVPKIRNLNGIPTHASGTGRQINSLVALLLKNGYMSQDSGGSATYSDIATLCLSAMAITVETIEPEERVKSLKQIDKKPQNEADKNNEAQRKNYTDDSFPNPNDPYYEMDQIAPEYISEGNKYVNKAKVDNRAITDLVNKIGIMNSNLSHNFKLKQLVENK